MSLIAASAIAAGAGIANSLIGNSSAKKAAKQQYKYQLALQQQNQNWQEEMSNTAHQREVADLKAAGLNPVLSANNGASAGSGGVGSASMAQTQTPNLQEAVNTALQAKTTDAMVKKAEAETGKTQVEAYKTLIDAGYTEASISKAEAERQLIYQNIENAKTAKELMEAEKKLKDWEGRHPILTRVLPASGAVAGATIGGIVGGPIGAGIGFGIGHGFKKPNPIGFNR